MDGAKYVIAITSAAPQPLPGLEEFLACSQGRLALWQDPPERSLPQPYGPARQNPAENEKMILNYAGPSIMHSNVAGGSISTFNCGNDMKEIRTSLIGLVFCVASLSSACLGRAEPTGEVRASEAKVLEMKSVPEGHFLVNLQGGGRERLVNFEVKDNGARCVNSNDGQLKGLQGKFQLIGNGVFLISLQNEHHRASQFWVFRKDGSAIVKEVPDRGERQVAVPVKDDSLEEAGKKR